MTKLIIENRTEMVDDEALVYVREVIRQGKISETSKGKQYCFVTTFHLSNCERLIVSCMKNSKSDRFILTMERDA